MTRLPVNRQGFSSGTVPAARVFPVALPSVVFLPVTR